ncbi:response regulator [Amycolatopsis acidicola]|nr:response regulator [Amycolatopsis acidicola]
MTDHERPADDGHQNSIEGNPGNTVQLRNLHGGIYINSQIHASSGNPCSSEPRRPLHVLAVDDESHGLEELVFLLQEDHRVGEVAAFTDTTDAARYLGRAPHDHPVDAVFLDVRMPGLDGLDLARLVARFARRPGIVLVTAFEGHAVEAFDIEVQHYLLKPLSKTKLGHAIDRLWRAGHGKQD